MLAAAQVSTPLLTIVAQVMSKRLWRNGGIGPREATRCSKVLRAGRLGDGGAKLSDYDARQLAENLLIGARSPATSEQLREPHICLGPPEK